MSNTEAESSGSTSPSKVDYTTHGDFDLRTDFDYPATAGEVDVRADVSAIVSRWTFRDHKGYERRLGPIGGVNRDSVVMASICELGFISGVIRPFQGAASMWVDNVVPQDGGFVTVRGYIGWDSDLLVQVSLFVA